MKTALLYNVYFDKERLH